MKVTGIINILTDTQSGVSQRDGREWFSRDVVLEIEDGENGRKNSMIASSCSNGEVCKKFDACKLGDKIEADMSFFADAKPWKCRDGREIMIRSTKAFLRDFKVLDESGF